MTNKAGEQPTITQADRDAAAAYWEVSMIGSSMTQKLYKSGEFDSSLIVQAFARHRTTSLAAQDEGLISDKSRIERLRRLVHRWITQGQVLGVVHDMDLQCEIDDAFAWANENGISAPAPSLAAQDGLVEAIEDLRHNYRAADAGGEFIIVSIYSVNTVLDALSAIKGDK